MASWQDCDGRLFDRVRKSGIRVPCHISTPFTHVAGVIVFNWIRTRLVRGPTIEAFHLDSANWAYHGERQEGGPVRIWETPDLDSVSLHFFPVPPNLPRTSSVEDLFAFFARQPPDRQLMVEARLCKLASRAALRFIFKVPQNPSGMMYQGSLLLPYRDFSYVVKLQCFEHGMTGIREAVLYEKRLAKGEGPDSSDSTSLFAHWNPDGAEFDDFFPAHPLSRLRRLLGHVERSATLEDGVNERPGFPLPTN